MLKIMCMKASGVVVFSLSAVLLLGMGGGRSWAQEGGGEVWEAATKAGEAVAEAAEDAGEAAGDEAAEAADDGVADLSDIYLMPEELTMDEQIRRQELVLVADQEMAVAANKYMEKEYGTAVDLYKSARKRLQAAGRTPAVRDRVAQVDTAIEVALVDWADSLAEEGRRLASVEKFDDAIARLNQAAEINPKLKAVYQKRIAEYQDLKDRAEFARSTDERTVDPDRRERERRVRKYVEDGKVELRSGRLMQARDSFDRALLEDPYNIEAIRYNRQINQKLTAVAEERRQAMQAERVAESTWRWSEPVTVVSAGRDETRGVVRVSPEHGPGIYRKMERIVFPRIEFEEATMHQVVRFLRDKSKELDPDGEGVNIIYRSGGAGEAGAPAAAPAATPFAPEGAMAPGGAPDFGAGGADWGAEFGADAAGFGAPTAGEAAGGASDQKITISIANVPLGEAIRYICIAANLNYKVEDYAIIIATKDVVIETMELRTYDMQAGAIEIVKTREAEAIGEGGWGVEGGAKATATTESARIRQFFTDMGVEFPPGSQISYVAAANKLTVKNTLPNLQLIERLLRDVLNVRPTQVTIEAKFVEISQNDLEALGFEWMITNGDGNFNDGLIIKDTASRQLQVLKQTGDVFPFDTGLTRGLRYAADMGMIVGNSADSLLALRGILGDLEFYNVIHALNRAASSDVLSSPKVTATNGQTAILRMVTERYFPESWTEPEITTGDEAGDNTFKPSIPEFGEARDIGVVLEATPQVDPDGYTINLLLRPQVTDFLGYDTDLNYEMILEGQVVEGKAQMPIISARTVETNVMVWDGETVVLGGMINEMIEEYHDKVPVLGDIPLVGRLFQSKGSKSEKINLLIFVTARLVDPTGHPVRANNEVRGLPDFKR